MIHTWDMNRLNMGLRFGCLITVLICPRGRLPANYVHVARYVAVCSIVTLGSCGIGVLHDYQTVVQKNSSQYSEACLCFLKKASWVETVWQVQCS